MAKVWLDVSCLPASRQARPACPALDDGVRRALAAEPGYFAFCVFDEASGFRSVEADVLSASLREAAAKPPARRQPEPTGIRGRFKELIATLPPAVAFARAGARLLTAPRAGASAIPPQPVASPAALHGPFGAGDVYVSFAPTPSMKQRVLDDLSEKLCFRVALGETRGTAAPVLQSALVAASRSGTGFEERLQHLYTSWLEPGDFCVDIGAHMGRHSLPMSLAVGAGGGVAAFEPNPSVAQRLRARLLLLSVMNVTVHETALSDEAGTAEFVIAVDRPEESGLRQRSIYNGETRTEKVPVALARLDSLELRNVRFIKLDTEGAEYKVMLGAKDTVARCRPVLAFEFGEAGYAAYGVEPREVFDYFQSLDYGVCNILGEELGREQFAEASRVQRYWDYVACPRDTMPRTVAVLRSF